MSIYITIISLGLLIFLSHVFNELFDKTKIPNVLLLLLIGIIIGPVSGVITKDFFGILLGLKPDIFKNLLKTNKQTPELLSDQEPIKE